MNPDHRPGRHRGPGGHSALTELKSIARETAQPVMKSAAVVAAAGGLVATFANPASAETRSETTAHQVAAPKAAAAIGPDAATTKVAAGSALSSIGYQAVPVSTQKAASPKPIVITDVKAVESRKAAAEKAAAKKAATERAATQRASRDTARTSVATRSGTQGQKSSHNWATAGQCTWGALNKWYQSEGYYPGGWTGNAMVWAYGAANAGYTVSSTPRTRSIVVMQPGVNGSSSVGHVAWVTGVSGNQVTIIEMNALAGAYNYNTRTVTNMSGMKYIYAP